MNRPTPKLAQLDASPATASLDRVRYLVGVDGGGTGTRVRLSERSGRIMGHGESGPSALGQGVEQAWRRWILARWRSVWASRAPT